LCLTETKKYYSFNSVTQRDVLYKKLPLLVPLIVETEQISFPFHKTVSRILYLYFRMCKGNVAIYGVTSEVL